MAAGLPNERLLMRRDLWEDSARKSVRLPTRRVAGNTLPVGCGLTARMLS
jgi:hypothetical protein